MKRYLPPAQEMSTTSLGRFFCSSFYGMSVPCAVLVENQWYRNDKVEENETLCMQCVQQNLDSIAKERGVVSINQIFLGIATNENSRHDQQRCECKLKRKMWKSEKIQVAQIIKRYIHAESPQNEGCIRQTGGVDDASKSIQCPKMYGRMGIIDKWHENIDCSLK